MTPRKRIILGNDSDDIVQQLRHGDAYNGRTVNCKHDLCNCAVMENAAAEIEALRAALYRYGDRKRMAFAPAELQPTIDAALALFES